LNIQSQGILATHRDAKSLPALACVEHVLVIVKPETVVAWHRAGFRMLWRLRSRPKNLGRPKIDAEVRALIQRMVNENPSWGAPRIHGET